MLDRKAAARADSGTAPSFRARTGVPASVASTSEPTRDLTTSCTQCVICLVSRPPPSSTSTSTAQSWTRYKERCCRPVPIACDRRAPALLSGTHFQWFSYLTYKRELDTLNRETAQDWRVSRGHLRARRSSALVPASFGPPAVSRSDVRRPLPPRWELVLPPPEVVDDVRLPRHVFC